MTLSQFSPHLLAIVSVVGVSLLSMAGVLLFLLDDRFIKRVVLYIVSFSTGALLGDVFIHILPEMAESDPEGLPRGMLVILAGILFSFAVEKLIHWRHCHMFPDEACCGGHSHHEHHHHPMGLMSTIGEALHNFIDGIVIAAAFLANVQVGISTALAVVFHEIPHEIGNVAVLLHSGYSKKRALWLNFLSACMCLLGGVGVLVLSSAIEGLADVMLPFAAGNLLYIAGSDLIPALHKETRLKQGILQFLAIAAGMAVMYLLLSLE